MNDDFRELKTRVRKLNEILQESGVANVALAQALSRLERAERRGDRSRQPTAELKALLERAEAVARSIS